MRIADWIVVIAYFAYVIWEGVRHGRKNKDLNDYFRGQRSLRWWAIGLSVMATQASAITYIGTTGQAYGSGMSFIQIYLSQPLVMVVLCFSFVPFFYRANIYTAYEYLEKRFDARTRSLTSLLFLLSRGLAVSLVLYAPSIVLGTIFGWREITTVLVMGLTTVLYTAIGGNKAVILVDAKQMLLMFAGIFVAIGMLIARMPQGFTFASAIHLAGVTGKWNNINLSMDPTITYTLLSGMVGGFFLALSYFGCDQSQVQRYITGRSLSESRISLIFNAFVKVPMQFLMLAIGVLMFVFYHFEKPPLNFNDANRKMLESLAPAEYADLEHRHAIAFEERRQAALSLSKGWTTDSLTEDDKSRYLAANHDLEEIAESNYNLLSKIQSDTPVTDVNYVFPSFLLRYAPTGVLGIMLAIIFAAAMSSFSSEINSLASASVIDFYQRYFRREAADKHYLLISRAATVFWGAFATVAAIYASRLGSSIIEAVNVVGSYFYGPILGVFLLAFLARSSTGSGAFWGLIVGEVAVFATAYYTSISYLYYNVVGAVAVLLTGLLISYFQSKIMEVKATEDEK